MREKPSRDEARRYRNARSRQALYCAASQLWMKGINMGEAIKIVSEAVAESAGMWSLWGPLWGVSVLAAWNRNIIIPKRKQTYETNQQHSTIFGPVKVATTFCGSIFVRSELTHMPFCAQWDGTNDVLCVAHSSEKCVSCSPSVLWRIESKFVTNPACPNTNHDCFWPWCSIFWVSESILGFSE